MTNQEIADLFTTKIPENAPKDLYDRYVELAIFINQTTADGENNTNVISGMADNLALAYTLDRI